MSEDSQKPHRHESGQGDKFIPPPMDPYATYQTPYERRSAPEPNPFIEFRRFADKQISDMFSAFPALGGAFSEIFGTENGMKDLREQLERDVKQMLESQKKLEDLFGEKVKDSRSEHRASTMPATSKEGMNPPEAGLKDVQCDWSPVKVPPERYHTIKALDGKRFHYDKFTGQITEEPDRPLHRGKEDSDSPRARWRRGFKNCPELQKYQGHTELDVYESLEEQQESSKTLHSTHNTQLPWPSWLAGYGHDGKQRMQKNTVADSSKQNDSKNPACGITTYFSHDSPWLDPFNHDGDMIPWLLLSRYSPLFLTDANLPRYSSVKIRRGDEGDGYANGMTFLDHTEDERPVSSREVMLRKSMADNLPWCDAFEDLMSLEKTGKMPWRDFVNRPDSHDRRSSWLEEVIFRGSLGSTWGLKDHWKPSQRSNQASRASTAPEQDLLGRKEETTGQEHNESMSQDFMGQVADEYLHRFPPGFGETEEEPDKTPESARQAERSHQGKTQQEISKPDQAATQPPEATPSHKTNSQPPAPTPRPSIISTLTTMTTRTLPDGSIETKRMLKKRFADGKEESEESTELVHPQQNSSDKRESGSSKEQNRPGWFWT